MDRNAPCYCMSGKKYKNYHGLICYCSSGELLIDCHGVKINPTIEFDCRLSPNIPKDW